jgi:hypothetical protein
MTDITPEGEHKLRHADFGRDFHDDMADFYDQDGLGPYPTYQPTSKTYPLHATPEQLDRLAETIADMLDNALHLEACWISEDETRCVCIIGALRAVLPRCGHVEMVGAKKLTRQCLSTVHPSAAYKHVFGVA